VRTPANAVEVRIYAAVEQPGSNAGAADLRSSTQCESLALRLHLRDGRDQPMTSDRNINSSLEILAEDLRRQREDLEHEMASSTLTRGETGELLRKIEILRERIEKANAARRT
jgi:hypothetical protein